MSFCQPHLERKHVEILATRVAFGTPMCEDCFGSGEEVTPKLKFSGKIKSEVLKTIRPTFHKRKRFARRGSGDSIIQIVSAAYGVNPIAVKGEARTCPATVARQVSMFIIRNHLNWSWAACGKLFNRHHTTAIYAVESVRERITNDEQHRIELGLLYKQATGQDL